VLLLGDGSLDRRRRGSPRLAALGMTLPVVRSNSVLASCRRSMDQALVLAASVSLLLASSKNRVRIDDWAGRAGVAAAATMAIVGLMVVIVLTGLLPSMSCVGRIRFGFGCFEEKKKEEEEAIGRKSFEEEEDEDESLGSGLEPKCDLLIFKKKM